MNTPDDERNDEAPPVPAWVVAGALWLMLAPLAWIWTLAKR